MALLVKMTYMIMKLKNKGNKFKTKGKKIHKKVTKWTKIWTLNCLKEKNSWTKNNICTY